ncbi:MAG: hypothetical protein CL693_04730 [Cellvibrionaceae bacterium]|nr:hypothetical protein [Cellvibrionaceae bacterium]|tara:strand:- start:15996 stop:17168 length:1173 start_codon:yes stop_codon:yes gene_type:complete
MNHIKKSALSLAVAMAAVSAPSMSAETITEALKEGDVSLSFRMRYEEVDVDGNDVDLTSLKTRLTYKSADYKGFGGLIEMDDVTHISDFEGGVGDPEGTEVNQAYLAYTFSDTTVKYGRQRILLDNQRFVGGVGFRQNEQTYDGLTVVNKSLPDTTLFAAHIDNVNRIFGEDDPRGDHENDTYLFNAKYTGFKAGALTAYAYLIDNEDAAAFSTDTYGIRFAGKTGDFGYALEYATQSDAEDNPNSYDADYILAEGSYKIADVTLKAGYEVLGADDADGQFITPLATLHNFQGWNDQFLGGGTGNITGGIEDMYVSASTKLAGVKLSVVYHSLESDDSDASGKDDLGSELGFVVAKKFGPVGLSLKYSDYSADDHGSDTDKLWLTASASF